MKGMFAFVLFVMMDISISRQIKMDLDCSWHSKLVNLQQALPDECLARKHKRIFVDCDVTAVLVLTGN